MVLSYHGGMDVPMLPIRLPEYPLLDCAMFMFLALFRCHMIGWTYAHGRRTLSSSTHRPTHTHLTPHTHIHALPLLISPRLFFFSIIDSLFLSSHFFSFSCILSFCLLTICYLIIPSLGSLAAAASEHISSVGQCSVTLCSL